MDIPRRIYLGGHVRVHCDVLADWKGRWLLVVETARGDPELGTPRCGAHPTLQVKMRVQFGRQRMLHVIHKVLHNHDTVVFIRGSLSVPIERPLSWQRPRLQVIRAQSVVHGT